MATASEPPEAGAAGPPRDRAGATGPVDVLWSLGVPTTPPRISREESARGLALLDLSLRMNHVTRISERLTYSESSFLSRAVSMDLDLRTLTSHQLGALRLSPGS